MKYKIVKTEKGLKVYLGRKLIYNFIRHYARKRS